MTDQLSVEHKGPGLNARGERSGKPLTAALAVVCVALGAVVYWLWPTTTEYRPMHASYAYDVTNLRLLNGQADEIVLAEVADVAAVDEEAGTTSFMVTVTDTIKGTVSGTQCVEQLGFVETTGKKHVTVEDPDQPLLRPGTDVLLTLGREPDGRLIAIGGPRSVVVLDDADERLRIRSERADAARNAEPVRDASGRIVLPVRPGPVR